MASSPYARGVAFIGWWLPLFLFGILIGLSMDYHMLLPSMVKEAYGRGQASG
ncbi:MAG: hypothetical protein IH860_08795 [Chloroflexi bacterium]|nr:hypothetical protein [Chloroflexota bacterium]